MWFQILYKTQINNQLDRVMANVRDWLDLFSLEIANCMKHSASRTSLDCTETPEIEAVQTGRRH